MDLKEKLVSAFLAFENTVNIESAVHKIRSQAIKSFDKQGFPTKKEENWKYTSLRALLQHDYNVLPKKETTVDHQSVLPFFAQGLDTYKIVFVDGKYASHLSETTHDKIDVCLMSSALAHQKYQPIIQKYFNQTPQTEGLTALNTAFSKEGAYIYIPKNKTADKPIEILHFTTGNNTPQWIQPRNLIIAEENAHLQVIERHQALGTATVLTNSVTEIFVNQHATIDYYKIQNDCFNASLIDTTSLHQKNNSEAAVHTFSFGGKMVRNNLRFTQDGEHIQSTLNGITIIEDTQHVDHNTLVHHTAPNCQSHQNYKGIFDEKSIGVFNGKIMVDQKAQNTNAFQSNNNILLDDRATINSKPQLEIFADDVKCSHGCTIGQLDQEALFYLRSRGIATKEARALLMYAFANHVLEGVKIPEIKSQVNTFIAEKLHVNLGFDV